MSRTLLFTLALVVGLAASVEIGIAADAKSYLIRSTGEVLVPQSSGEFDELKTVHNPFGKSVYVSASGNIWIELSTSNWVITAASDCGIREWLTKVNIATVKYPSCNGDQDVLPVDLSFEDITSDTDYAKAVSGFQILDVYGRVYCTEMVSGLSIHAARNRMNSYREVCTYPIFATVSFVDGTHLMIK